MEKQRKQHVHTLKKGPVKPQKILEEVMTGGEKNEIQKLRNGENAGDAEADPSA